MFRIKTGILVISVFFYFALGIFVFAENNIPSFEDYRFIDSWRKSHSPINKESRVKAEYEKALEFWKKKSPESSQHTFFDETKSLILLKDYLHGKFENHTPKAEEIDAFYQLNLKRFTIPEKIDFAMIFISRYENISVKVSNNQNMKETLIHHYGNKTPNLVNPGPEMNLPGTVSAEIQLKPNLQRHLSAIKKTLKKGKDFFAIADQYDENQIMQPDHTRRNIPFKDNRINKKILKTLKTMKVNDITYTPIETDQGYYFLKLLTRKPETTKPLEEVKDQLFVQLKSKWAMDHVIRHSNQFLKAFQLTCDTTLEEVTKNLPQFNQNDLDLICKGLYVGNYQGVSKFPNMQKSALKYYLMSTWFQQSPFYSEEREKELKNAFCYYTVFEEHRFSTPSASASPLTIKKMTAKYEEIKLPFKQFKEMNNNQRRGTVNHLYYYAGVIADRWETERSTDLIDLYSSFSPKYRKMYKLPFQSISFNEHQISKPTVFQDGICIYKIIQDK